MKLDINLSGTTGIEGNCLKKIIARKEERQTQTKERKSRERNSQRDRRKK